MSPLNYFPSIPTYVLRRARRLKNEITFERELKVNGILRRYEANSPCDEVRFGFFGELGFALACYLPYLKYLNQNVGPIKTAGLNGSSPFFEFSSDHIEIDVDQTVGWGDLETTLAAKKKQETSELIYAPIENERHVAVDGLRWCSNKLAAKITSENYLPLDYSNNKVTQPANIPGEYILINVKNQINWVGTDIHNFYYESDIALICDYARRAGIPVLLNYFPAPSEKSTQYVNIDYEPLVDNMSVFDLSHFYSQCQSLSDKNSLQMYFLFNAKHIFASQGGNGYLSLCCGQNVTILMRGGHNYPSYLSMANIYKRDLEVIYELSQSKAMRELRDHAMVGSA